MHAVLPSMPVWCAFCFTHVRLLVLLGRRSSSYLYMLSLAGNMLTGAIPPELALPRSLSSIDLRNNSLTCRATSNMTTTSSRTQQCEEGVRLPCFLSLAGPLVLRADGTNMQCPRIVRKAYSTAIQDCGNAGPAQLVSHLSVSSSCFCFCFCFLLLLLHSRWVNSAHNGMTDLATPLAVVLAQLLQHADCSAAPLLCSKSADDVLAAA